ncbi:MAG: hypothetical protein ACYCQJ_03580 [Nitrososphaerales archaeon]
MFSEFKESESLYTKTNRLRKGVFAHGLELMASQVELNDGLATLSFDNAVEMAMYACLEYVQVIFREKANIDDLIRVTKESIKNLDSNKDPASVLHDIELRNLHIARD